MIQKLKKKIREILYDWGFVIIRVETWISIIKKIEGSDEQLKSLYQRMDKLYEIEKDWHNDKIGNIRAIRKFQKVLLGVKDA